MKNKKEVFTFIDLFAGIGGFRVALEQQGGKCLGFSEIDKQAIETYKSNFFQDGEKELGSVTELSVLPKCDVLVGGVPCQSWSVAGKMRGFEDPRGQLWFDTIRLVEINRPKAFIFENVKGLADPRNSENLRLITDRLSACGYKVYSKVQNSYDFGLPQNRERVFLVGIRSDLQPLTEFHFPKKLNRNHRLYNFFDDIDLVQTKKTKFSANTLFGDKVPFSRNKFQRLDELNDFFTLCDTRNGHSTIHSWDIIETSQEEKFICLTILKNRRKKIYGKKDGNPMSFKSLKNLIPNIKRKDLESLVRKNILKITSKDVFDFVNSKNSAGINNIYRVYLPSSEIFSTLTATGTKDYIAKTQVTGKTPQEFKNNFIENILLKENLRKITITEARKLQGFPSTFKPHHIYNVAMKQFGNAVSVPVVEKTMAAILQTGVLSKQERKHAPNFLKHKQKATKAKSLITELASNF